MPKKNWSLAEKTFGNVLEPLNRSHTYFSSCRASKLLSAPVLLIIAVHKSLQFTHNSRLIRESDLSRRAGSCTMARSGLRGWPGRRGAGVATPRGRLRNHKVDTGRNMWTTNNNDAVRMVNPSEWPIDWLIPKVHGSKRHIPAAKG